VTAAAEHAGARLAARRVTRPDRVRTFEPGAGAIGAIARCSSTQVGPPVTEALLGADHAAVATEIEPALARRLGGVRPVRAVVAGVQGVVAGSASSTSGAQRRRHRVSRPMPCSC
jgi:hypothetical protein